MLPDLLKGSEHSDQVSSFHGGKLSTLRMDASSSLNGPFVKLPYMGASTLQARLIEIANEVGNDAKLARIAGISRSAVNQWRAGAPGDLRASSAANIQEETGYSVRWLILGKGPKKLTDKPDAGALSDKEHKLQPDIINSALVLLKSFLDSDDEIRHQIVTAVEALTDGHGRQEHKPTRPAKRRRA